MSNDTQEQSDVYTRLKQMVDNQMRAMHTASPAIVQKVDHDSKRVEVALKEDKEVFIGDVPIASVFARNGEGVLTPLEPDDEGLLIHTREPLYNKQSERGHAGTGVSRHHTLESAVFFPMYFYDSDEKPPYDDGQLRIYLKDAPPTEGAKPSVDIRIDPYAGEVEIVLMDAGTPMIQFTMADDGSATFTHVAAGTEWKMDTDGLVKINGEEVVTKAGQINDTFLGLGGGVDDSGQ